MIAITVVDILDVIGELTNALGHNIGVFTGVTGLTKAFA
jgi:hypothetical protein